MVERKHRACEGGAKTADGIEFNHHIDCGGAAISAHACKLGREGIVAKRKDARYESGGSKA